MISRVKFIYTLFLLQLWRPNLLFEDQYHSEAESVVQWTEFSVIMESGPLADDISRVREG